MLDFNNCNKEQQNTIKRAIIFEIMSIEKNSTKSNYHLKYIRNNFKENDSIENEINSFLEWLYDN